MKLTSAGMLPPCHQVDNVTTSHKHHRHGARECRFIVYCLEMTGDSSTEYKTCTHKTAKIRHYSRTTSLTFSVLCKLLHYYSNGLS